MAFPWMAAATGLGIAADLWSASKDRSASRQLANQNAELQKEFAQHGIRWRVKDAKAAGLHPLFALSGQPASFSPTHQSFSSPSVAGDFSRMGQGIERAIEATRTKSERAMSMRDSLALERAELENELLRSQIAVTRSQVGPPMPDMKLPSPLPGQGNAGALSARDPELIEVEKPRVVATQPREPSQEAGAHAGIRWERTASGWKPAASQDVYQEQDITSPAYAEWWIRNRLVPVTGFGHNPPPDDWLPEGATGWMFNAFTGEYVPSFADTWYERGLQFTPRE